MSEKAIQGRAWHVGRQGAVYLRLGPVLIDLGAFKGHWRAWLWIASRLHIGFTYQRYERGDREWKFSVKWCRVSHGESANHEKPL